MTDSNQPSIKRSLRVDIPTAAIVIISFLGFLDASYLTAERYFTLPLPCSLTQGCDTVLTSPYSAIAGIPVAFFGVLYYVTILFCAVYFYTSERQTNFIPRLLLAVTSSGLFFSFIFVFLQLFVIHALCAYCLGSALFTFLLFISSILLGKIFQAV